jgi:methionyl-tRNA synthetase
MLKAHGEFILPDNVPANEFLNLEGQKISTSRNWAVWLHEFLEDLPGRNDALRYTLTACAPETKDNDFTWKEFQSRNNNELADILGNFVNRAIVLTHKYFEGKIPSAGPLSAADKELESILQNAPGLIGQAIEQFKLRTALTELMNVARAGNRYLAETEPWKLIKTDPERVKTILHLSLQTCALLGRISEPFLPETTKILRNMLPEIPDQWPDKDSIFILKPGNQIGEPKILFSKITDEEVEAQLTKLQKSKQENQMVHSETAPEKPGIPFEEFSKMDLRVATILSAEAVPKTKKLLKIELESGLEKTVVVSGIAEHYSPETLPGKQVLYLANLAEREIKGIMSKGMLLLAEDSDGKLHMMGPDGKVKPGSQVK